MKKMSKSVLSGDGELFIDKAAQHLKKCASERNLTKGDGNPDAIKISEAAGIDRRVISDILKAKNRRYRKDTFNQLDRAFDKPEGYFAGLHEFDTHEKMTAFQLEKKASQQLEVAQKMERVRKARLESLLLFFGFTHRVYDNDVHELVGDKDGISVFFTDDQFQGIIEDISDRLEFECYKQRKKSCL